MTTSPPAEVSPAGRRRAYLDLAKVDVPELWLGVPLAWSVLPSDLGYEARTGAVLALALVVVIALASATQALDDVQGFEDGTDRANYGGSGRRPEHRKPLLQGRLTPGDAKRFGAACGGVAVAAMLAASALTDFRPRWLLPAALAAGAIAVQYSYGTRLSYRALGAGELTLLIALVASVVLPYSALTGTIDGTIGMTAVLLGGWILQNSLCSSSNDAPADRAAGRRTVPAVASAAVNRAVIAGLFAVLWLATVLSSTVGNALSPWVLVALLPAWVLQGLQLARGVARSDWLEARTWGFRATRVAVLGLFGANVLTTGPLS